jgi:hypothetical protein
MALFPEQVTVGAVDNTANPYGFTAPTGPATQALVPYYNKVTGQTWNAPSGGYTPPSADWMQGSPGNIYPMPTMSNDLLQPAPVLSPVMPINSGYGPQDDAGYQNYLKTAGSNPLPYAVWSGNNVAPSSQPLNYGTSPSGTGGIMGLFSSSGLKSVPETSQQQTISPYAQPYVSDLLSKAQAFTGAPMPAYEGQLTAGYSPLQQQAWSGLAGLTLPTALQTAGSELQDISEKQQGLSFTPTDITTGQFSRTAAEQYMNPYIQAALDPQLAALKRQADINRQAELAKLTQAGAYGGSREAILRGQQDYNLMQQQAGLIGSGYNQAYQQAMNQFNADQARALQAQQLTQQGKQFGATYGLQGLQAAAQAQQAAANAGASAAQYGLANLQALSRVGTEQQALDQQALNAQYNEYLRQLKYPQEMLKLQREMLTGLPVTTTQTFEAQKSAAQSAAGAVDTVTGMIDKFKKMGMSMPDISKYINMLTKTNPIQTGGITVDESGNLIYPTSPSGGSPYDDEGNLMPGWGLDENNNPVWVSTDYVEPTYDDYYDYSDNYSDDYGYTNPDNNPYESWWDTESYD